jgi:uncharacterized caspase-like protein
MTRAAGSILLCGLMLLASAVGAQADKRVALVVGVSAYQNAPMLPNPARDARAMATMFQKSGFDVVSALYDTGNLEFKRAIRQFEDAATGADIAVIYFAGHGIEIHGVNYLVPADAKLASDRDADDEAITLDRLLTSLDGAKKLRLVILDACRDDPFVRKMMQQRSAALRGIYSGLATVEPTTSNTLIAYAAKAGAAADDGQADHSPFTTALLNNLFVPGLDVRLAFGRVRDEVFKKTASRQEPFVYGSLGGANISIVPAPEQSPQAVDRESERQDYARVEKIGTKRAWQMFLAQYPKGFYADLARENVAAIERAEQIQEEQARRAQAEQERLAKEQAEQQRLQTERDQLAAERAGKERLAKEQAEKDRLAKAQAEKERLAKEQVEQQRLAAERARVAAEQAEKERLAKAQAEKDRLAQVQAEKERLAKEQAEQQRLATERARLAAEQAEKERLAKAQADKDRLAKEQAEKERLAKEQVEQQRLAAERARVAADQAEKERLAKEQADKDRLAKVQAEQEQLAKEQAERQRLAQQSDTNRANSAAQPNADPKSHGDEGPPAKIAMLTPPPNPPSPPTTVSVQPSDALPASGLVVAIKNELHRVGCYSGAIDNQWTSAEMKPSLDKLAKYAKLSAVPANPDNDLLVILRGKTDRVCPLQCNVREVARDGQCVAKTCPSGTALDDDGDCTKPAKKTATLTNEKSSPAAPVAKGTAAAPYDPNDRSRRITPGGQTTCGPNGCEKVPPGCYAVRGMHGGHGLGGKIICGTATPPTNLAAQSYGRGYGRRGYNPDGSRRGYGPSQ